LENEKTAELQDNRDQLEKATQHVLAKEREYATRRKTIFKPPHPPRESNERAETAAEAVRRVVMLRAELKNLDAELNVYSDLSPDPALAQLQLDEAIQELVRKNRVFHNYNRLNTNVFTYSNRNCLKINAID
jgi:hypothetical protein